MYSDKPDFSKKSMALFLPSLLRISLTSAPFFNNNLTISPLLLLAACMIGVFLRASFIFGSALYSNYNSFILLAVGDVIFIDDIAYSFSLFTKFGFAPFLNS